MFRVAAIVIATLGIATSAQAVACAPNLFQAGDEIMWQGSGEFDRMPAFGQEGYDPERLGRWLFDDFETRAYRQSSAVAIGTFVATDGPGTRFLPPRSGAEYYAMAQENGVVSEPLEVSFYYEGGLRFEGRIVHAGEVSERQDLPIDLSVYIEGDYGSGEPILGRDVMVELSVTPQGSLLLSPWACALVFFSPEEQAVGAFLNCVAEGACSG